MTTPWIDGTLLKKSFETLIQFVGGEVAGRGASYRIFFYGQGEINRRIFPQK